MVRRKWASLGPWSWRNSSKESRIRPPQKKISQSWDSLTPGLVTEGSPGRLIPPPIWTSILLTLDDPDTTSEGAWFGAPPKISGQGKHSYSLIGLRIPFLPRDSTGLAREIRLRQAGRQTAQGIPVPVVPITLLPSPESPGVMASMCVSPQVHILKP